MLMYICPLESESNLGSNIFDSCIQKY